MLPFVSLDQFHCYRNEEIQVLNDPALGELLDRANLPSIELHLLDYLFSHRDYRDFYVWIYGPNKNVYLVKTIQKTHLFM